jgi:hypothetical protein
MKCSIVVTVLFFFFEGCSLFYWQPSLKTIDSITPDAKSESFFGILTTQTIDSTNRWVTTRQLVHIDSRGLISQVFILDSSSDSYHYQIINDTAILFERYDTNTLFLQNPISGKITKLLNGREITTISNNRKYIAVSSNIFSQGFQIYELEKDHLSLIASDSIDRIIKPIGENRFMLSKRIGKNGFKEFIVNPELSIYDSDLFNMKDIDGASFMPGCIMSETVFITYPYFSNHYQTPVLRYNENTKKVDTLFTGLRFQAVNAFPIVDHYLLKGMTFEEYKEEEERIGRAISPTKKGECTIPDSPEGYWMVANSKNKQIRKIGFRGMRPIISSRGRYILFYKKDGDGYEMKVVSVKELVEGM